MARVPTRNQFRKLFPLGGGSAGLSWSKRSAEPLINHGWVTADWKPPYYQFVRITPDGLRALALAIEKYGMPGIGPNTGTWHEECTNCGSRRRTNLCRDCRSTRYRIVFDDIQVPEEHAA